MYVITDDEGRVRVSYTGHAPQGAVEVVPPEGWDAEHQQNWRLINGVLVYVPEPEPEPLPTNMERLQAEVAALQADNTAMLLALADMIGGAEDAHTTT